jgi:hypothetical protein
LKQIGYLDNGKVLLECSEQEHKLFLALAKTAAGKTRYDQQMNPSRFREGIDADLAAAFETLIEWMDVKDASNELRHLAKVIDGKIGIVPDAAAQFKLGDRAFIKHGFDDLMPDRSGQFDGKQVFIVSDQPDHAGRYLVSFEYPVGAKGRMLMGQEWLIPAPPDPLPVQFKPGDNVFIKTGFDSTHAWFQQIDGMNGEIAEAVIGGYIVILQIDRSKQTRLRIEPEWLALAPPDPPADPPGYTIR